MDIAYIQTTFRATLAHEAKSQQLQMLLEKI